MQSKSLLSPLDMTKECSHTNISGHVGKCNGGLKITNEVHSVKTTRFDTPQKFASLHYDGTMRVPMAVSWIRKYLLLKTNEFFVNTNQISRKRSAMGGTCIFERFKNSSQAVISSSYGTFVYSDEALRVSKTRPGGRRGKLLNLLIKYVVLQIYK